MSSGNRLLAVVGRELTHFSGFARLNARWRGGAGVVLAVDRVCPVQDRRLPSLKAVGITPERLDRAIDALKRWGYDLVSMDEVCRRARQPRPERTYTGYGASVIEWRVLPAGITALARS